VVVTPRAQLGGSPYLGLLIALPIATLGCARGAGDAHLAGDAGQADGARPDGSLAADASPDAGDESGVGCAIAAGMTPVLDGTDDLAQYPSAQRIAPGAALGADTVALAWSSTHLFVTASSQAFGAPYTPLHVYLETGTGLATAAATAHGKEYGGLVAALPFTPTHLVAVRRVSDSGTSGAYNGVFVPADGWTDRTLDLDAATFVAADHHTLSVQIPWGALGGCPTHARLALHVVHGQLANEWKDLVPSTHTPWQMPGGGYYEIDLTGSLAVSAWTLR
jgi:hypothetical protein